MMFKGDPNPDLTLEEWQDCRNYYVRASYDHLLPENVIFACRIRARYAAENVRRSMREIEDLELLWALPEYEWRF
jgi:hypothetical protein